MIGNDKISAWCIAVFILYVNGKNKINCIDLSNQIEKVLSKIGY